MVNCNENIDFILDLIDGYLDVKESLEEDNSIIYYRFENSAK